MYTFTSSLHRPDDKHWRADYGYSDVIAEDLTQAYILIKRAGGRVAGYAEALDLATPRVKHRMSQRQRLHLYFILATTYAALGGFNEALCWTDRALPLAYRLGDLDAQLELFDLHASFNRALLLFEDAIEDRRVSIELLDFRHARDGLDDPAARLHTYALLAACAFFAARPRQAQRAIHAARALAPRVPDSAFDEASTEWVQAHLYRTYRQPERALRHTLGFYTAYTHEASATSTDRLEFFLAEVALEWADRLPPGSDRNAFLDLARPHLAQAQQAAAKASDPLGHALTQLTRAHLARLGSEDFDCMGTIETAIQLGDKVKDVALQAQAYTALGDEFTARNGEDDTSALQCYRHTLYLLDGSQVPILALPAKRAVLHAQEMDPGEDE